MESSSILSRRERPERGRGAPGIGAAPVTVLGLILLSAPLVSRPAHAADPPEEIVAREHYDKGQAAFQAGRYAEASREFEAGYELSRRPAFLLNMAHAERRQGELRKARERYRRYLLVDPESNVRGAVESVLEEIERALAAEVAEPATAPAPAPSQPAATEPAPVVPPPLQLAPPAALRDAPPSLLGGADTAPVTPGTKDRPVYRRWWFWATAGAVAAATVLTGLALRRGGASYARQGSLGTLGTP
jgi:tetratricopeptide (TPR) repeat protein